LAAGFAALYAMPAWAHHSVAMFDMAHTKTLNGVIKAFEWTNPHAVIWFVTVDDKGAEQLWPVEMTSPGNLARSGWSKHSLNPGDKVSVELHPLRDGRNGGALQRVTLTDTGKVLDFSLQNNKAGD
jgi:hypothetical protein